MSKTVAVVAILAVLCALTVLQAGIQFSLLAWPRKLIYQSFIRLYRTLLSQTLTGLRGILELWARKLSSCHAMHTQYLYYA